MRWGPVSKLRDLADEVMTVTEQAFADADIDLPERRFVSNNGVAYDCEQFSVEIGALSTGTAGADQPGPARLPKVAVATLLIALIRDCQPLASENGSPPSVEDIEAASDELLADASVLIKVFMRTNALGSCSDVSIQTCVPYGPEGGLAGWVLTIRAGLS